MKYCSKCGKEMDDNALFCTGCGAKLEDGTGGKAVPKEPKKGGKWIWAGAILSVVILVLGVAAVYISCFRIPKSDFLYEYDKSNKTATLIECKNNENVMKVKIPEKVKVGLTVYTVTVIGDDVFSGCDSLADAELPDCVESIGDSAFKGCESLTGIVLPDDLKRIGDKAFKGCKSLTDIEFPKGLKSIGDSAFAGCESLGDISIPDGVKVGEGAFDSYTDTKTEAPAADTTTVEDEAAEAATYEASPAEPARDYGTGEITIWAAENVASFTQEQVRAFQEANPQYAGYTVTVEPVGEGDAAGNMITDVEGGADIYGFVQDQLPRLVSAGALMPLSGDYAAFVREQNDAGAAKAATLFNTTYAFPLTSDNGYFLYYDKSVISDPTSLDAIVRDCEAAGRNFYFELNSGWYQPAFFFGTGCELSYDIDDYGNFTDCNIDYASAKGVAALKAMIKLHKSSAFNNGSSASNTYRCAAIVDGTWDATTAQELFGDSYACAKLPTFTVDGVDYQMSGFGGFKLLGVKPQSDCDKQDVCLAIAQFLSSEEAQIARYDKVGWGPSNVAAQQYEIVKTDEALSALAEQLAYSVPQGQYPGDYWSLATSLGDSIISGDLDFATDDELMEVLEEFQYMCQSYS